MRTFSILSAVIAFALSGKLGVRSATTWYHYITRLISFIIVNAASVSKRTVDPNVQTCINDMTAAGAQLLTVTDAVSSYIL